VTTQIQTETIRGEEHWTSKGDVRLFLWHKPAPQPDPELGTLLFVHGSSMASTPTFDLHVPGRSDASAMDVFASLGYDTWTVDHEGYGRSSKHRDINSDIATGADDLAAATEYILGAIGARRLKVYGISSGALRAALFTQRHPDRVARLALDAFVWTGEGSPTLAERRKRLPEYQSRNRRPIDRAFVHSIFTRDHPGTADDDVVEAFADAILALDDSVPTGTYVDMCSGLPVVDPSLITVPTLIMRGGSSSGGSWSGRSRQALRRHARDLPLQLPPEELPPRLPHPPQLPEPARTRLPRLTAQPARDLLHAIGIGVAGPGS
jgi:pimeloyl-ACP methyl ester carboxylesterase